MANFKSEYLSRTSFPYPVSYMILNQLNQSFPTVYNMTYFDEEKKIPYGPRDDDVL